MTLYRSGRICAAVLGFAMLTPAPTAIADPPPDDFYAAFFKTPDGRSCGIRPNGGPVGCDAVPYDAGPSVNQTLANSWGPAQYKHSDTPTFTRDVDVLPEGQRLQNWGASCGVGLQGTVTCKTYGPHGFILASTYSVLW